MVVEDARYQRFNLRVPRELLSRLEQAADARSHSTNAEILDRLEKSFESKNKSERVVVILDGLDETGNENPGKVAKLAMKLQFLMKKDIDFIYSARFFNEKSLEDKEENIEMVENDFPVSRD